MCKRHLDTSKMRIRPQSAPPRLKVFGRSRTLLCSPRPGVGRMRRSLRESKGRARMMRCPAASDLWQPTRKELTALPLEVHEKITDFVWKSTKSQLRLPRRSVRKSRAMPPLEVRGRRNSVNSIPMRPAAQLQTPRTVPREIPPNAVQIQIRA